jgi:serine/threonine-protein kinase
LILAVLGRDAARAESLLARVAASASETDEVHAVLERRGEAAWDARLLEAAKRPTDAARAWERAGESLRAAALLEETGDVIGAARVLEGAVRRDARADALLALGALLLRYGKTEAAVRSLQKIAPDAPERRRALTLLRDAFDALGLSRARVDVDAELTALGGPSEDALRPAPAPTDAAAKGSGVRGRLFGRYGILREVASSASARVVECTDTVRGEHVAVKIFAGYDSRGGGRDALARFEREVRILGRLDHPNVVPLRDYIAEGPAIVLAWMRGGTLEDRLAEAGGGERGPGGFAPARAVEIACALLSALGEAHRVGVLHRDVKPANVLFDEAGVTRLGDFGVAHLGDLSATATAGVIGTLAYMSPEQREGRPATAESDVYAVGAILFEMLTGERLGADGAAPAILPSGAHRDLDARHDEVTLRLFARDPAMRPSDAFAARSALRILTWPSTVQPAAPRARERTPSERPRAGRAEFSPDGSGYDRWIDRPFEHVPLTDAARARASAFARAGHPSLQGILRVDRDSSRIWLEPARGQPLATALTSAQTAELRAALDLLHAAGVAHGRVDRAHVVIDETGTPLLRFTAATEPTSTIDRDRLALARLGESP